MPAVSQRVTERYVVINKNINIIIPFFHFQRHFWHPQDYPDKHCQPHIYYSPVQDGPGKSPGKKATSTQHRAVKPRPTYPPLENRACPVPGCDSKGHLSGKLERHFTHDACPTYHNTTEKACREMVKEWDKKDTYRRKALAQLQTKSPLQSPSR